FAIVPDRHHGKLPAAMPISHRAILCFDPAVDVDAVPLRRVADIIEQQVVLLRPEERNRVEALARSEDVARRRLTLAFGDHPVLDADSFPGQPVGPTGNITGGIDARNVGLEVLIDCDAAIDCYPGVLGEPGPRPNPDTDNDEVGF